MIAVDEEALICDLAETYGILNFRSLPARTVAILAVGLRENSRIKMKMSGMKVSTETLLLASIADYLALIWWSKTEEGQKNEHRPAMIRKILLGLDQIDNKNESMTFDSGADFEAERERILRKGDEK